MSTLPAPTTKPLTLVKFLPGNGTTVMLPVTYWAEFLRGEDGTCAFCHGDPCAEDSEPESLIAQYFASCTWAGACPCCDGRPT